MDRQVLNIREDICLANGKDPAATELLEKMKTYGEVTPFEKEVATIRAEYQAIIDGLTKQLNAIKDQELTEDEIIFLNFYRERIVANCAIHLKRIDALEVKIKELAEAAEKKAAQLRAILDNEG